VLEDKLPDLLVIRVHPKRCRHGRRPGTVFQRSGIEIRPALTSVENGDENTVLQDEGEPDALFQAKAL
jgi:hypothetical protein